MTHELKRIGLIGDVHAEYANLKLAIDFLEARNVDLVVSTGDVVDGDGSVDCCCELISTRKIVTVRGNHDRWFLTGANRNLPDATPLESVRPESRALLEQLPVIVELSTSFGVALLCHGLGKNDMAKVTQDDYGYALDSNFDLQELVRSQRYRLVLNGHTHQVMVRQINGVTIVNGGTIQRDHNPSVVELDFTQRCARVFALAANGNITESGDPILLPSDSNSSA
jgi:putative phosphoesterase